MELSRENLPASDILSLREFAEKKGRPDITNEAIQNRMKNDELDWVKIGWARFIVWNERAEALKFSKPRERTALENF